MEKIETDSFSFVWIVPRNSTQVNDALTALKDNKFMPQANAVYPDLDISGRYDFWVLIHIDHPGPMPFPLAVDGYGSGGDSIWTLNELHEIIQSERVSNSNRVRDRTGHIRSADLSGIGLNITTAEKMILLRIQNYRFGSWDLPELYDARIYESHYYQKNLTLIILFWVCSGVYIALLIFYILQYIQVPQAYLFWNILFILSLYLPALDGANWIFASFIEVKYHWFDWKVFNEISPLVTYICLIDSLLIVTNDGFKKFKIGIIGCSILVVLVDGFFLLTQRQSESLIFYFIIQKAVLGIDLLIILILAFQREYIAGIITTGAIIGLSSNFASLFMGHPFNDLVPAIGLIIQLFIFAYAMNYRIKLKDKAALELKHHNKLLQLENANIQHTLRQEVAHDIHDEVGSTITKLSLAAQWAKINPKENLDHSLFYDQMVQDLSQVSQQVRDLVFSIHPGNDSFGELQSQIRTLSNEFLVRSNIHLIFEMNESDTKVGSLIKRNILAITREALHNIIKHSKATQVIIRFQMVDAEYFDLMIQDNGKGFDLNPASVSGYGQASMKSRAERIGSQFKISSYAGEGTTIHVVGPIKL